MSVLHEIRRRSGQTMMPLLLVAAAAYFGYHFFAGERGLNAWWSVNHRLELAKAEHESLRLEREKLEMRVSLMREDTLDRDLLDERLRRMLNLVQPDDVVILYAQPLAPDQRDGAAE